MTVELICVGTELLLGNIVNTNAAFLSRRLADLGLTCYRQSVVGDNEDRLVESIRAAAGRSDVVILCGGLGPTGDDLTKESLAAATGKELVEDMESRSRIQAYFASRNQVPTANNWKQALIPVGARAVKNENGTAPGIILEDGNTKYILLPGPPNELEPMFDAEIAPYLRQNSGWMTIRSATVKVLGVGESRAVTMIADMLSNQGNPTIAPYAKTGEVHFRVTAKAVDEEAANALIAPVVAELRERFGNRVYTTESATTLENHVCALLREGHLQLATAESCTGGMVSSRLVSVPGASDVIAAGFVTYNVREKQQLLGVSARTISQYGAVSAQCACEMAMGAATKAGVPVAISVTGVAGPDSSEGKPVGQVFIGTYLMGQCYAKQYQFTGGRPKIREAAAEAALAQLREALVGLQPANMAVPMKTPEPAPAPKVDLGPYGQPLVAPYAPVGTTTAQPSSAQAQHRPKRKSGVAMVIVLAVLIALILGLLAFLTVKVLGKGQDKQGEDSIESTQQMSTVPADPLNPSEVLQNLLDGLLSPSEDSSSSPPASSVEPYKVTDNILDTTAANKLEKPKNPDSEWYAAPYNAFEDVNDYTLSLKTHTYKGAGGGEPNIALVIEYPEIASSKLDESAVQAMNTTFADLYDFHQAQFAAYKSEMSPDDFYNVTVDAFVTYMDDRVLSVVYEEAVYLKEGEDLLGVYDYVCVNCDMERGVVIDNPSVLDIDEDFVRDFRARALKENGEDNLADYTDAELAVMMRDPDKLVLFYTPKGMEVGVNLGQIVVYAEYADYGRFLK